MDNARKRETFLYDIVSIKINTRVLVSGLKIFGVSYPQECKGHYVSVVNEA